MGSNNRKDHIINLLLVESDDGIAAEVMKSLAGSATAINAVRALNLAEARSWLDFHTPDIVIVDSVLPDGKGSALLHPDRSALHFPVILLADAGHESAMIGAIKSGAVDCLVKSTEMLSNLPRHIERALREWGYILRQRLTEDALRDSEERFRSIFSTTAAGLIIISPLLNIIQVNSAFCSFIGYDEIELLNRSILDLVHEDDMDRVKNIYAELFAQKLTSADCERRYVRKDGSSVWGHVSISCVVGDDGRPAYCIALLQDISLRKALEEKLMLANRELDAFVHTVSHDLRSPLTPLVGYLYFLLEQHAEEFSPHVLEMLNEMLKEGERMYAMLEDLLALATVGSVQAPTEPVSGDDILESVVRRYQTKLSGSSGIVSGRMPDILIPRTLYLQIVDNLIGNALNYSGGKAVEVSGYREDGRVYLSVRDHGPGVPDTEKERIFELFFRGVTGKKTAGTGIGLATVKKIVSLYGGRVWVEDAVGGGSLFVVELYDGL